MTGIHPAPARFSALQIASDPILHFFHYAHLPAALQSASRPFCDLAEHIVTTLPRNPERTVALEAKDAAVRAPTCRPRNWKTANRLAWPPGISASPAKSAASTKTGMGPCHLTVDAAGSVE